MRLSVLFPAVATAASLAPVAALASPIIPYAGAYDEAVDGPGDFDLLGGADDLGLFYLQEGANTFTGNINAPQDTADSWLIGIAAGYTLVSASISWATNLPGIPFDIPVPPGFLAQSTWGANAPHWTLEESDDTPTIFRLDQIEAGMAGGSFDVAPANYDAPAFDARGEGIYLNIFDGKTTCSITYVPNFPGVSPECTDDGLDYTITYTVEKLPVDLPAVPLPAGAILLLSGIGLTTALRRKARS